MNALQCEKCFAPRQLPDEGRAGSRERERKPPSQPQPQPQPLASQAP